MTASHFATSPDHAACSPCGVQVAPLRPASHPLLRVPVLLCEIKRSHVRRPVLHSMFAARSMVGKIAARGYMYRSSRWGAPRLWAVALSSLPACAPSPLAGRNLLLSFHAPSAHARPNALTLNPPGFVLPVVALAPPRFPTARASLIHALSLPCGARFARPYANAFPPPLWAPLRSAHATQARVRGI